ncbi:DUF6541 family protein [uncultured Parolsenella sp.]|uniref:DUF6541 family protein n=1 Tax=uncultured Parolsenella sp. TaxID=2083008 RepID=UPI0025F0F494|nr:DUF6541 family protein [uncultured Parolsenella sp.]
MSYVEWLSYFMATSMMGLSIIVPGYIVGRGALRSKAIAFCASPCLSIALYSVAGIVLGFSGKSVSAIALIMLALLFSFLLRILFSVKSGNQAKRSAYIQLGHGETGGPSFGIVGIYVFSGLIASFAYYLACLDGPNSFANASDTCAHLNYVRAFVESGSYSVLKVASSASLVATGGFYPAAWHVLVAIAAIFTRFSITMAANVVNFLILVLIFPSACALLLGKVFTGKKTELLVGAIACVCFVGFPWVFLVWGQLVSNLLGFALVPVFVFLFDELLSTQGLRKMQHAACLLLAILALVFAQPNAVFSAGIFCIPSIFKAAQLICDRRNCGMASKRMLLATVAAGIIAVWLVLYKAPFMRGVVSFDWRPNSSLAQSVANALCLAYGSLQTAQPFLAILVLFGFIRLAADESRRGLCGVYLLCLLIYLANNTSGFPHSHVLSGFWYNDPYRTGAMLAMASIPLACSGMSALLKAVLGHVRKDGGPICRGCTCATVIAVSTLALLFPSYELPGYGYRRTGFGAFSELMTSLYSYDNTGGIDSEEWKFLERTRAIVGNSLILNIPEDGSGSLYGVSGMNILFRRYPADPQDPAVAVLGKRLSKLSDDSEVRCKVRAMAIKYVMMLDCHANIGEGSTVSYANQPDLWSGVYSIDCDTPGFDLLLSEGDMRLYRIDDELVN